MTKYFQTKMLLIFKSNYFSDLRELTDVIEIKNLLKLYENDMVMELNLQDVDTFLEQGIFDVDDHEFICEVAKNGQDMVRSFYKKISNEKFIRKGSFDCVLLCLKINKPHSRLRKKLEKFLSKHQKPEQGGYVTNKVQTLI